LAVSDFMAADTPIRLPPAKFGAGFLAGGVASANARTAAGGCPARSFPAGGPPPALGGAVRGVLTTKYTKYAKGEEAGLCFPAFCVVPALSAGAWRLHQGKAAEGSRTPRRFALESAAEPRASVLECGCPLPLCHRNLRNQVQPEANRTKVF
jgi:hypothetical protein